MLPSGHGDTRGPVALENLPKQPPFVVKNARQKGFRNAGVNAQDRPTNHSARAGRHHRHPARRAEVSVRLGISAPTEIPIHRREVWELTVGTDNGLSATSGETPPNPHRVPGLTKNPAGRAPSVADLDQCLQWIARRTGGRMSELTVERVDGRIVIRGSARSYYVRQLGSRRQGVSRCWRPSPLRLRGVRV